MSDAAPWWTLRYEAMAEIDPSFAGPIDDRAEAEVAFLTTLMELGDSERILDVGCGAGRHSTLLQEAGHLVTGVDLSPRILRLAREGWDERNPGVRGPTWMPGDMRWLPASGPYDAAILMDHTLGMFDDDAEHLRAVTSVADLMRPNGRVVLQLLNPYRFARRPVTQFLEAGSLVPDADIVRTYRFDVQHGRLEDDIVAFKAGRKLEVPTQSLRMWTPAELTAMLRGAGFRRVEIHGSEGWDVPDEPVPVDAEESVWLWVLGVV
jgi:SAM-dependent methyltransferase